MSLKKQNTYQITSDVDSSWRPILLVWFAHATASAAASFVRCLPVMAVSVFIQPPQPFVKLRSLIGGKDGTNLSPSLHSHRIDAGIGLPVDRLELYGRILKDSIHTLPLDRGKAHVTSQIVNEMSVSCWR